MPSQIAADFAKILALVVGVSAALKVEPASTKSVFLDRWVDVLMLKRPDKGKGFFDRAKDAAEHKLMRIRLNMQLQRFEHDTGVSIDFVARISAGLLVYLCAKIALRVVLK